MILQVDTTASNSNVPEYKITHNKCYFHATGWNLDTVRALESIGLIGILMVILFSVVGVAQDNGQTWKTFSILTSFGSCKIYFRKEYEYKCSIYTTFDGFAKELF